MTVAQLMPYALPFLALFSNFEPLSSFWPTAEFLTGSSYFFFCNLDPV